MLSHPRYDFSDAQDVIDLYEAYTGRTLDTAQRLILTHGLGRRRIDDSQKTEWAAQRVAFWMPRQNGKGEVLLALELAWLFLPAFSVRKAVHSAHLYPTSQAGFEKLKEVIEGSSDLMRALKGRPRLANGEQGFTTKASGPEGAESNLRFMTRTVTGARGLSAPRVVFDEGQEVRAEHMGAIAPTLSAMVDPQLWFCGTPPKSGAEWCYALKEAGEEGDEDLVWMDWGRDINMDDPEDAKRAHDLEEARLANPAYGTRIMPRTVINEMKPSGLGVLYPAERLGVWPAKTAGSAGVISEERWRNQALVTAERPEDLAMAVMVNHVRKQTAIVAVGKLESGALVMTMMDYRPGTAWVAARVLQLKNRWNPVAIAVEDRGPTATLLPELREAGLVESEDPDQPRRGELIIPHSGDVAVAYGQFVDAVNEGRLFHLDEVPLNVALAGAGTRALGSGTAWDYRGQVDTAPLRGATNALWAYLARADVVDDGEYDVADSVY